MTRTFRACGNLRNEGLRVIPLGEERILLPDPDDYPFVAAARAALCPVVTGNLRHTPSAAGVRAISPARFLAQLVLQPAPGAK